MKNKAQKKSQTKPFKQPDALRSLLVKDAETLLERFWQRTSDACPLECSEAEHQEEKFRNWVKANYA